MKKITMTAALLVVALCITTLVFAQTAPADNMQILRDKIKADKKMVVAANMQLTESEAKGFWQIYDAYQNDLEKINKRVRAMIKSYAGAWNTQSMDNQKAKKLTSDFLAISEDEVKLTKSYVPRFNQVLPATKVARYIQIENKIRTLMKYDAASEVPLVPDKTE